MASLKAFDMSSMLALGSRLRISAGASSLEEIAQRTVGHLWSFFADEREQELALVRFYVTTRFRSLENELKTAATSIVQHSLDEPTRCLTLLATRGLERAWNDRHLSAGHRAIPLVDPGFVARLPMVVGVLEGLGLDLTDFLRESSEKSGDIQTKQFSVFLVEKAEGSAQIPAQTDFVQPFGVQSVIGFGGALPNQEIFVVLLFARVALSRDIADLFSPLSLSVKLAALPFCGSGRLFAHGNAS